MQIDKCNTVCKLKQIKESHNHLNGMQKKLKNPKFFMINNMKKLGMEASYANIIKVIYGRHIANII
jgi:hypothetical protein